MKATEILRFGDHLGALVHDTDDNTLHGVSWGSRRFYRWALAPRGTPADPKPRRSVNSSHYVDYQDCKYAGRHRMLCAGVADMRQSADGPARSGSEASSLWILCKVGRCIRCRYYCGRRAAWT